MCKKPRYYRGKSVEGVVFRLKEIARKNQWVLRDKGYRGRGDGISEKIIQIAHRDTPWNTFTFYVFLCKKGQLFVNDMPFECLTVLKEWIILQLELLDNRAKAHKDQVDKAKAHLEKGE